MLSLPDLPVHCVLNDFCGISQAGEGATAKLQESGWGHIQVGKMILGSQAGGGDCFIMTDELLVFPQNASPWNFTNFACGTILCFSNFFLKGHY